MQISQDLHPDLKNHANIFNLFAPQDSPIETLLTQIFEKNFSGNHTVLS